MIRKTTIEAVILHTTGAALKISTDGDPRRFVWLPKQAATVEHTGRVMHVPEQLEPLDVVDITIPESLAIEKGLV